MKTKELPDLSWITEQRLLEMNAIRERMGMKPLVRKGWTDILEKWQPDQIQGLKWYVEKYYATN